MIKTCGVPVGSEKREPSRPVSLHSVPGRGSVGFEGTTLCQD